MENKFTVDYASILKKIEAINPVKYAHSRNYIDGQVNYLSPYISRAFTILDLVKNWEHICLFWKVTV